MAKSKNGKLRPPTATRGTVSVGVETQTPSLGAEKISIPSAIFLGALSPLKIIEQLRPSYARRYRRRLLDLSAAYSDHEVQNGTEAALDWLIKQVFEPSLPDLRQGKSTRDDWTLNDTLGRLATALAPVFRETKGRPRTRLMRVEPIVSEVLGRPWKPTHAMTGKEPVPSTYSSDRLTPRAAGIRDAVHRREAPSPPYPGSATAHCEAQVRLSTAINVSASRCSSRRTSTSLSTLAVSSPLQLSRSAPTRVKTQLSVMRSACRPECSRSIDGAVVGGSPP
jgi:hypothetical protein